MRERTRLPRDNEPEPMIADVGGYPIKAVLRDGDSALDLAMQLVVDDMDKGDGTFAAHGTTP